MRGRVAFAPAALAVLALRSASTSQEQSKLHLLPRPHCGTPMQLHVCAAAAAVSAQVLLGIREKLEEDDGEEEEEEEEEKYVPDMPIWQVPSRRTAAMSAAPAAASRPDALLTHPPATGAARPPWQKPHTFVTVPGATVRSDQSALAALLRRSRTRQSSRRIVI